jgi:hypothetical protein
MDHHKVTLEIIMYTSLPKLAHWFTSPIPMKHLLFIVALFPGLMISSVNAADETISTASLLRDMTDLSRLPLRRNWSSHLTSCSDPTGGNKDYNQYISKEGNTALLADLRGPGAIVRIWFTGLKKVGSTASQIPAGTLNIYIDDAPTPVINRPIVDLFKGTAPFVPPFTRVSGSAYFTYLPISYAKHCRVTVDLDEPEDLFYQINSLQFPDGTKVRPFALPLVPEDQTALNAATTAWTMPVTTPADAVAPTTAKLAIPSGGSADLPPLTRPGTVQSLTLTAPTVSDARLRKLILRGWFDGHATPDIEAPVADFFGNAYGHKAFDSLVISQTAAGEMTFRLPMPFNKSARFAIENGNTDPVTLDAALVVKPGPLPPDSLYLHADFNQEITQRRKAHTWCRVEGGLGHFVGVVQAMQGNKSFGYCEGDDQIRVDDENFLPSLKHPTTVIAPWNGTGTEDFFNSAFYFSEGTNPRELNGCLVKQQVSRIDAFRFLLNDAPVFQKSIDAQIENNEMNYLENTYYASVAFWYGDRERVPLAPMPAASSLGFPEFVFSGTDPRFLPVYTEGESLVAGAKASGGTVQVQEMKGTQYAWSSGSQLLWKEGHKGDTLTIPFKVATAGDYTIQLLSQRGPTCGHYSFAVNGAPLPRNMDGYRPDLENDTQEIGTATLPAGRSTLTVTLNGKNGKSSGNDFGLDMLVIDQRSLLTKPKLP